MSNKISIVVPAYNAQDTIADTLKSLLEQTYQNLEILVIDDGSADKTGDVASRFCDASGGRIRYHRQDNAGQATALNNGWKLSSGDYLGYLSADDIVYPDAMASLAEFLDHNPEIAVVYPDYDLIDAESKVLKRVNAPDFDPHQLIEHSVCQPGPGALFRRTAFERTGGWNPKLRLTPDFDFWLRLSRHGSLARFPRSLAGFRVHESSQSFAPPSPEKSEEPAKVIEEFLRDGGKWNKSRAMAWAHVLSTRLHVRGGRPTSAIRHLSAALREDASIIGHLRFWHLLASGAFGRLRYRLQGSTRHKR